jgi:PAS domain-containing protein
VRFRRSFELAGSGVALIGLDRRFLVNRRLCEILGYPGEAELLGLAGQDIAPGRHGHDQRAASAPVRGRDRGDPPGERYFTRGRTARWSGWRSPSPSSATAGAPQYEIAVYDDIEQHQACRVAR